MPGAREAGAKYIWVEMRVFERRFCYRLINELLEREREKENMRMIRYV